MRNRVCGHFFLMGFFAAIQPRFPGCRAKGASSTRATQNGLRDKIQMSKNGHARRAENPTRGRRDPGRARRILCIIIHRYIFVQ